MKTTVNSRWFPLAGRPIVALMKTVSLLGATCLVALLAPSAADAQPVARGDRPVLEVAAALQSGEYVWAPELSGQGSARAKYSAWF